MIAFFRPRTATQRRFRRRLLLPPGWIALSWLLVLGCAALGPWQHCTGPWSVTQLTMPRIVRSSEPGLMTLQQVRRYTRHFRNWRTFRLAGKNAADSATLVRVADALRNVQRSTLPQNGVRVSFRPKTSYASFIKLISLMEDYRVKRYWFDNYRKPAVFYALPQPAQSREANRPRHLPDADPVLAAPTFATWVLTRVKQLTAEVQRAFHAAAHEWTGALSRPEWQLPWLLLAAIVVLNGWRWRPTRP